MNRATVRKLLNLILGFMLIAIIPALFISCKKKGPTELSQLKVVVASQSGKDQMDIIHKAHEKAGIDCYKCHHKWENPDRIRNCSNCHRDDVEKITKDTCLKCHMTKD
jgi:hypothetical protein